MIFLLYHIDCKCFLPFMQNFQWILQQNNMPSKIVNQYKFHEKDDVWFVIWNDLQILPPKCIIYNMDPMVPNVEYKFRNLLDNNPETKVSKLVDYAYSLNINIFNTIDRLKNTPKLVMPYGYSPYHKYIKESYFGNIELLKDIDILFYGNVSQRRIPMIQALQKLSDDKNYVFVIRNNNLFDEPEKIMTIQMAKIVVSFASYDTKLFQCNDLARSAQVLSDGGFVITEYIGDKTVENLMSNYTPHYNTIEELVELVDYYLTNPEKRDQKLYSIKQNFSSDLNLEKYLLKII